MYEKINSRFKLPRRTNRILIQKKEPTNNDPSWYNLYSDGWVEQGGYYTISSNVFTSFNLLKEMADTNYTITGSSAGETASVYTVNFAYLTTTAFNAKTGNASSGKFSWQVCGYTSARFIQYLEIYVN